MLIHIAEAKHIRDYVLWIKFDNGVEGEIDLSAELWGEMFEPFAILIFSVDFVLTMKSIPLFGTMVRTWPPTSSILSYKKTKPPNI